MRPDRIVVAEVRCAEVVDLLLVKTTLLSAALGAVVADERIVCVEDAPELALQHPHLVRLVGRVANVAGTGEITFRQALPDAA